MQPNAPILTRLVEGGRVVPWWKADRVRLPHEIMHSVAYLYTDQIAAEDGDSTGAATAFWVSGEFRPGAFPQGTTVAFVVTNRHVIERGATTLRWLGRDGTPSILNVPKEDWFFSSNPNLDLALWTVPLGIEGNVFLIPTSRFLIPDELDQFDVRIGDDIFMVGRHLGFDGKIKNTPTARFGHLVQYPLEDIEDDKGRKHKSFLVQMPSLPGFSGSPVFLYQNEIEKNAEHGRVAIGQRPRFWKLLGVNLGHLKAFTATYHAGTQARNQYLYAEINSGINVVIPSWDLGSVFNELLRAKFGIG